MNKPSNKVVALIAVLLFAAKGNAQIANTSSSDEKVSSALSKIQQSTENDPDLLSLYLSMQKTMLESELTVDLTDDEFASIQGLIGQLLNEGVALQPVPFGHMILATQEVLSGK